MLISYEYDRKLKSIGSAESKYLKAVSYKFRVLSTLYKVYLTVKFNKIVKVSWELNKLKISSTAET